MRLIDRAKNIILTPKTEWDVIAGEATEPKTLVIQYVLPLAAIAAVAGFIGMAVIGVSMPLIGTMVFVLGFIIDALAPTFGGQKNLNQAVKVAAYCYTPVWVASVVKIIPLLGILVLIAAIYAIYLLFLGLPRLMKNPEDKSAGYTAVVVIVAIVVGVIIGIISGMITGGAMMGAAAVSRSPTVTYEKNSSVAKLDEFAKKMEEAGKKMEAAQKSGDTGKQMEAAMATLGTAMSGGKGVDPVSLDQLKPFVPDKFAGLPRTDMRTERGGVTGFMVAKVEGIYGDSGGKSARLEVSDTGGAAGLMGLAAWMNIQGEREDANHREVTRREGDRMIHEEVDKRGGNNKFTVIVAQRYVVSAEGTADIGALKSSVAALDLGKLEAMKDATAPK